MLALRERVGMDSESLWKQFGEWFRESRRAANMTQEEVSKRAGITRQHLGSIEKGETGVKRDTLLQLADAIQADRNEVLQRAGLGTGEMSYEAVSEPMTDEEQRRIISRFMGKPRKAREIAESAIDAILRQFPDVETDQTTHGKRAK